MKASRFTLFSLCFLIAGCLQQKPRSGDLVFVGLPVDYHADTSSMSSGITASTGGDEGLNYIHTAILELDGDSCWIIDATIKHGVARYPLDSFLADFTLRDGGYPVFELMRLRDAGRAENWLQNAKSFVGQPYDVYFLPDNGAMYCTELIRDSYLQENGTPIFSSAPMNFKGPDGEFPPYWVKLFGGLGVPIPQGIEGTNPQDMHSSPLLKRVKASITE